MANLSHWVWGWFTEQIGIQDKRLNAEGHTRLRAGPLSSVGCPVGSGGAFVAARKPPFPTPHQKHFEAVPSRDRRAKRGPLSPSCGAERHCRELPARPAAMGPPSLVLKGPPAPEASRCQDRLSVRRGPAAAPAPAARTNIRAAKPLRSLGLPTRFERTAAFSSINQRLLEGRWQAGLAVEGKPSIKKPALSEPAKGDLANREWSSPP